MIFESETYATFVQMLFESWTDVSNNGSTDTDIYFSLSALDSKISNCRLLLVANLLYCSSLSIVPYLLTLRSFIWYKYMTTRWCYDPTQAPQYCVLNMNWMTIFCASLYWAILSLCHLLSIQSIWYTSASGYAQTKRWWCKRVFWSFVTIGTWKLPES